MIVISHPTGNANVRNAALALCEAGLLTRFVTTISVPSGWAAAPLVPRRFRRWGRRRVYPDALLGRITTFPLREWLRLSLAPLRINALTGRVGAPFSIDAVYRSLDRRTAGLLKRYPQARGVYCYEDGALETFRRAKALGLKTIYELPTPYWRCKEEIGRAEAVLQPEWAGTLRFDKEPPEKLAHKDEELRLADLIIVPSEFVAQSLQSAPTVPGRIVVLPYGSPVAADQPATAAISTVNAERNPLRIIYVGNLGQAKGISYLVEAFEQLERDVKLTLIGRLPSGWPPAGAGFLEKHRYLPSLPHNEVLQEMRGHDVLVLPTLYEGMALVVLEAMGQGLAVITTPHSGATGILRDGVEGFIVPIRSAGAIREKLRFLADNRTELGGMRQAALERVRTMTWENYRARLPGIVAQAIAGS
jgi:glycosyltransferase involved in cell wall biosynthesis